MAINLPDLDYGIRQVNTGLLPNDNLGDSLAEGFNKVNHNSGVIADKLKALDDLTVNHESRLDDIEADFTAGIAAATASKLAVVRTFTLSGDVAGSATFDGSANCTIGTNINPGSIVDADISSSAAIAQSKVNNLVGDLAAKAPLSSPALTGVPTAPTAAPGTNTTQLATTAFVTAATSSIVAGNAVKLQTPRTIALSGDITGSAPFDGSADISITASIPAGTIIDADISNSAAIAQSKVANLVSDLAAKAPLASPVFTGAPTAPTAAVGTNSTQLATTAYVKAEINSMRPVAASSVTYYVGGAGANDSNSGLTAQTPLATAQAAANKVMALFSAGLNYPARVDVTIKFAAGTYTSANPSICYLESSNLLGVRVVIDGNASDPSTVIFQIANTQTGITLKGPMTCLVKGITLTGVSNNTVGGGGIELNTTSMGIVAQSGAFVEYEAMRFGPYISYHLFSQFAAIIAPLDSSSHTIFGPGDFWSHIGAHEEGHVSFYNRTVTYNLSGSIDWQNAFASAVGGQFHAPLDANDPVVFNGTATGKRYVANTFGHIALTGRALTFLPGDEAGEPGVANTVSTTGGLVTT